MIRSIVKFRFSNVNNPYFYSNGQSLISISQWWNGKQARPSDFYCEEGIGQLPLTSWKLKQGIFRVVYPADLNNSSMNININTLKKSERLSLLLQLEASQKQKLVQNPATIIIKPSFVSQNQQDNQISKNMLQLNKLFQSAIGLNIAYLLNYESIKNQEYLTQIKKHTKAISADVIKNGNKLQQTIFQHGHKLDHVFLSGSNGEYFQQLNLQLILQALLAVDFKGKIILPGSTQFTKSLQIFEKAARQLRYSKKQQYELQSDGWYTML